MIRTETEYRAAVGRLKEEKDLIEKQTALFNDKGLSKEEIKNLIDPLMAFHMQLAEEVEIYEKLKQKHLSELTNLRSLGHGLICARIASGLTQQKLAERLGINASQVCRDERNEYHGITLDRAAKILEACRVGIRVRFEVKEEPELTTA
jgi:hypothetical protein